MKEINLWTEKYRFTSLEDCIGNEDFKADCAIWLEEGEIPNLLLHSISPGTGKSSTAFMLVDKLDASCLYLNAAKDSGIQSIRDKVHSFVSSRGFSEWKIVFLDEAGRLTFEAQRSLLSMIEEYADYCRFILTANSIAQIDQALSSRLRKYEFTPPALKEAAKFGARILQKENKTFEPRDLVTLVEHCHPDIRTFIDSLQRYTITGKLVLSSTMISNREFNASILNELQNKKISAKDALTNCRQLIANAEVHNFIPLYKFLYKEIESYATGHLASVILLLNEGQLRDSQVADKEINAVATLLSIINEIK